MRIMALVNLGNKIQFIDIIITLLILILTVDILNQLIFKTVINCIAMISMHVLNRTVVIVIATTIPIIITIITIVTNFIIEHILAFIASFIGCGVHIVIMIVW